MRHIAGSPSAEGGSDPLGQSRPCFRSLPLDHRSIDTRGGYTTQPLGGGGGSFSASMPPPPADPYSVDSPSVVPAPDGHMDSATSSRRPLYSRQGFEIPPFPSRSTQGEHQRFRARDESPRSKSRFREAERYREHKHHRGRVESSPRSHLPSRGSKSVPLPKRHRLEDGPTGSKSLPSSSKRRYHRLEDGRKASSRGSRNWYDDERTGSRGHYGGDGQYNQELPYPCDREYYYLGGSKRISSSRKTSSSLQCHLPLPLPLPLPMEISPWDDGYKSPSSPTYRPRVEQDIQIGSHEDRQDETTGITSHVLGGSMRISSSHDHGNRSQNHHSSPRGKPPLPMEISPWDDGYKSPSSPTYCPQVEQDIQIGSLEDLQDETTGCLYSAAGSCDGSGVAAREPNFKYEDPVPKTEREDSAYDALVDDFMDAVSKTWCDPYHDIPVDKDAHQKQTKRFAELALKRYNKNKNNKVKYDLVEAIRGGAIWEDSEIYAHVNFYAKAKNGPKKNDGKVLVFAELHHIGRRLSAMVLTCFRFLDESNQLCGRRDHVRNSLVMQDQDTAHCYACHDKMKHPDGSCYKAGHFVGTVYYSSNY